LVQDAGKLRFPDPMRVNMLRHVKTEIRRHDKHVPVALGKESMDVWKAVGLKAAPLVCNCSRATSQYNNP